jgi:hypothetical protein
MRKPGSYKNRKAVFQIDKETDVTLAEFESMSEASRETGISVDCISKVCRGFKGRKHAGGFKWEFSK